MHHRRRPNSETDTVRRLRVTLFAFVAVLIGIYTPANASANEAPSTLTWRVRTGTDVIGERFRLVDTDTLDLTTEYRGQIQTTWRYRGDDWTNILVDNRFGIGTLSARHDLDMRASRRLGPRWSIDLSGITAYRHYLDSADGIRSDFTEGRFVTTIRRGGRNALRTWGIEQGIEGSRTNRIRRCSSTVCAIGTASSTIRDVDSISSARVPRLNTMYCPSHRG